MIFLTRRGGKNSGGGSGIKFVEWLLSDGLQCIDIGFKPNQDTRVVVECEPTTTISAQQAVFGARNSNSGQATQAYGFNFMSSTSARSDYMGGNATISGTYSAGTRVSVDMNKNVCTVNGNTGTNNSRTGQSQYNLFLFNVNNFGTPHSTFGFKGKVFSCKVYDNGTLVHNVRPCYDDDGIACMYDEIEQEYHYNIGTGEFVAGEVVT